MNSPEHATSGRRYAEELLPRFDASPTPYHAVEGVAADLREAGFEEIRESDSFPLGQGCWLVIRGGSLVAWATSEHHSSSTGFRIVGAHTDSPNLRIKPNPGNTSAGFARLGVEVYGGALLNSWLDRDLGLAGRVAVRDGDTVRMKLFSDDRPLLRIPQLAIHLDRDIDEKGLRLNRQRHMVPTWAMQGDSSFTEYLAEAVSVDPDQILASDTMMFDTNRACIGGLHDEFLISGRIDNLLSCFSAADALIEAASSPTPHVAMICLFDHEEVGSVSSSGAAGPLLESIVSRIVAGAGGSAEERWQACADSFVVSADGAHATHPNYSERHDSEHHVALNAGPVLKVNANQRYATDAESAAEFKIACSEAGVELQTFVSRSDLACGSTIGPITSGRLGMQVVDAGCAQLAMHSIREMAGVDDPAMFRDALVAVLGR